MAEGELPAAACALVIVVFGSASAARFPQDVAACAGAPQAIAMAATIAARNAA